MKNFRTINSHLLVQHTGPVSLSETALIIAQLSPLFACLTRNKLFYFSRPDMQTPHLSVKFAVFNMKWVTYVIRADPQRKYLGGGEEKERNGKKEKLY